MMKLMLVFAGGGIGSVLRYSIGHLAHSLTSSDTSTGQPASTFPIHTLLINIVGCALIGLAWGLIGQPNEGNNAIRLALIIGLLGGFTTFSAFGWETLELINNNRLGSAFAYILISVSIGLLATWGGLGLGETLSGAASGN